MSFGYGVGDLLTLPVLAVQVYSAYKDAPDGYKHISEDVKSLQTIIDDAVKYLQNNALSDSKRREGQEALHSCRGVLEDLNALLEKYKSLVSTNKMQVFKRVKLGNEDIMTLRDRLVSSSIFLTNFIRRFAIPVFTTQYIEYSTDISIFGPAAASFLKWRHAWRHVGPMSLGSAAQAQELH